MESYGELELCWQLTPLPTASTNVAMLDQHTLIYNTDTCINALNCVTCTHYTLPISTERRCISCLAVDPSSRLIAYSEKCQHPNIILSRREESGIYHVLGHFEGGAPLGYTHLALSADSRYSYTIINLTASFMTRVADKPLPLRLRFCI